MADKFTRYETNPNGPGTTLMCVELKMDHIISPGFKQKLCVSNDYREIGTP